MKGLKSNETCRRSIESPASENHSAFLANEGDIHSKTLQKLAKKAASTCVGGVLSSNAFFEAFDKLRKPFKIAAPTETSSMIENCDDEQRHALVAVDDSSACNTETGNCATEHQNDHDAISSIAHLLDIGKFDMLEKPRTEKKWGKLSKAVQEKTIAVVTVKANAPVHTVDPTDLLLFYYSKHRNTIW